VYIEITERIKLRLLLSKSISDRMLTLSILSSITFCYGGCAYMRKVDEVLKKIEELRKEMNDMIASKDNLLDSEVIEISELLDQKLVEYQRLLKDKES
jgi:iron-sulfur cluster repair protein YtfE (RIC family)